MAKELTRVITIQATFIDKMSDEELDEMLTEKEASEDAIRIAFKGLGCDDIQATIQDFVMDVK